MKRRPTIERGMILFTTLLLLIFLMMIAAMLVVSAKNSAAVAADFRMREQALFAATAGINYAMAKMERVMSWRGDQVGMSASSHFQVTENVPITGVSDLNMVVGAMHTDFGVAKFYLLFPKTEAATVTHTGFVPIRIQDPDVGDVMVSHISSNNCNNRYSAVVSTFYDGLQWGKFRTVPPRATNIVCVGKCGNVSRTVEIMAASEPDPRYDSVAISNGDMNVQLYGVETNGVTKWPGKWNIQGIGNNTPIVRSNQSMSAGLYGYESGNVGAYVNLSSDGYARANYECDGDQITFTPTFNKSNQMNMKGKSGSQLDRLPRVRWADLNLEVYNLPNATALNAGTYVIERNGAVKYYATTDRSILGDSTLREIYEVTASNFNLETYSDYAGHSLRELASTSGSGIAKDAGGTAITITKDIKVQRVTMNHAIYSDKQVDLTDLVIIKEPAPNPGDPAYGISVTMQAANANADPPSLINAIEDMYDTEKRGGIQINGNISGTGAVFCKGNISFEGKSSLSADQDSGVSIYAKGNVSIKSMSFTPTLADDPTTVVLDCLKEYSQTPQGSAVPYSYDGNFNAFVNRSYPTIVPPDPADPNNPAKQSLYAYMQRRGYGYYQIAAFLGPILSRTTVTLHWALGSYWYYGVEYQYWYPYYTYDFRNSDMIGVGSQDNQMAFKGMIYSGNNIDVNAGNQSFSIMGGMVAYGGNPDDLGEGHNPGTGNINIGARDVNFYYDPSYLELLYKLSGCKLKKMYWANY